ncbi:MAG: hypothetical protein OK438_08260 [Thaumarchaeota archaeon]|nr:hypothetical protein [Nitrososphaerota archaeon]
MFFEKRVRSFEKLMEVIRHLDSDSGVRVVGSYLRKACFAFLTRSAGTYTVMVYERRGGRAPEPGARLLSREFESLDELGKFLRKMTPKGMDAYVY